MSFSRRDFLLTSLSTPLLAAPGDAPKLNELAVRLRDDHDLHLPAWGPYTKKYFGISHIASSERGARFDLSFFPGFFRRTPLVPNVLWESGYYPWEAAADLSYYAARFELEWKDRVYVDLSFTALDANASLVCAHAVNDTDVPQNLSLHLISSIHFPLEGQAVDLPTNAQWLDALDYADLTYAVARPTDHLMPDGQLRGEQRGAEFVGARGVGHEFGSHAGDAIQYNLALRKPLTDAVLLMRYRAPRAAACDIDIDGRVLHVELKESAHMTPATLNLGALRSGAHKLRIASTSNACFDLDGFVFVERANSTAVRFRAIRREPRPQRSAGPDASSVILKFKDIDTYYGLAWHYDEFEVREFLCGDLDNVFRYRTHNHVDPVLTGPGEGQFTDVFLRPVSLETHSARDVWAVVCTGTREQVVAQLASFRRRKDWSAMRETARARRAFTNVSDSGKPYAFSQERMAATTLCNVVYPIMLRGHSIRHNTPGRWWDSLYTWDSGFIGLGLLEHDTQRAVDCLNAYTFAPGDPHAAFLHHGSPVPVQIYLLLELWNRTRSRALLEHFYPRLRAMYQFLGGHASGSTTAKFGSHMLVTWDYFYNSGGWDDYPPQRHVHTEQLEKSVAPVCTTAHLTRCAKILRMCARELGRNGDIANYDADIATWSEAMQRHAWDHASGYFSYVVHDAAGNARAQLHHASGQNFNMGLDGITPLIAGACTTAQVETLCAKIASPKHLWTGIGLSTVDQSAAYYRNDGYWNGAVWMPHQWFVWKALLDAGRGELAYRIARTALELWRKEVGETYNCYEHFLIQSGRGAGWHQFGGLSTPVMCWFGAYHTPGRLSTGLDVWVSESEFTASHDALRATLEVHNRPIANPVVIATLAPSRRYRAQWDGRSTPVVERAPGVVEIQLDARVRGKRELQIEAY